MRAMLAAVVLVMAALGPAGASEPEPAGYRMSAYRGPTPAGLAGAVTVDTAAARRLLDDDAAIPINVQKADRSALPRGPWLVGWPQPQIPGGVWLGNVGLGEPEPDILAYFRANLERLTKGDPGRGLLFYCLSDCWLSWNAAKRALSMGYRRVYWYRDGIDGWIEAGLPTVEAMPEPVTASP